LAGLKRHCGNRFFYSLDLAGAYQAVRPELLVKILAGAWENDDPATISAFLADYCLGPEGGLAVGAPASPDLFNIYAGTYLDLGLAEKVELWGGCYTRYLDDLLISLPSHRGSIGKRKREFVRKVIESAGFGISYHKAKLVDLAERPILVNGFGLDVAGRLFVPDPFLRFLRMELRYALAGSPMDPKTAKKVQGRCAFLFGGRPRRHTKLEGEVYRLYRQWRSNKQ
jgi:hypothetical protein